jgi:hypothetical protein
MCLSERRNSAPAKLGAGGSAAPRPAAAIALRAAATAALALVVLALASVLLVLALRWARSSLAAALGALEPGRRWAADGLAAAQGALELASPRPWSGLTTELGSGLELCLGAAFALTMCLVGASVVVIAMTFAAVAFNIDAGAPLVRTSFTAHVLVQDLSGAPSAAIAQLVDVVDRIAVLRPCAASRELEGFLCILDDPSSVADRSEVRYSLGVRLDGLAHDVADQLVLDLTDLGFFERHYGTSPVLAWMTTNKSEDGVSAGHAFLKFVHSAAVALRNHVPNSSDPARAGGPASPFPVCVVRSPSGVITFCLPIAQSSVVFRTSSLRAPPGK